MTEPAGENQNQSESQSSIIARGVLALVVYAAVWFALAGRLTWWQGWAFLLAFVGFLSVLVWRVSARNPDLIRERNQPAEVAEPWDREIVRIYTAVLLILLVLAALDGGRFQWSSLPPGVEVLGWLLLAFAGWMIWHVMMTNAFLSSWARLQEDRGQVVVREGAYRRIRHPMYLGIIVGILGIPLALSSAWSLIPSIVIVGLFVYRTYREDRMLIQGLAGYAEYAGEVRYRLVPGVW